MKCEFCYNDAIIGAYVYSSVESLINVQRGGTFMSAACRWHTSRWGVVIREMVEAWRPRQPE